MDTNNRLTFLKKLQPEQNQIFRKIETALPTMHEPAPSLYKPKTTTQILQDPISMQTKHVDEINN